MIYGEKMMMSGELDVRNKCAKFHHCRICVTDFREGGLFAPLPPPICKQPQKSPF